jgi:HEAT repeat protein
MFVVALAALAGAGLPLHAQAPSRAPSLDEILKEISTYNGGIDSAAFWKLRDYVQARKDDPAARAECERTLLAFLETPATPVAKMAACRHLRAIGSEQAVPALQAMLADERASDLALYALQQIPGAAVDKTLLQALSQTTGPTKIAVIASLGERRSADAVPALVSLLHQPEFARASALALGVIGGEMAAQALVEASAGAQAGLKPVVAASLMKCAEQSVAAGNEATALRLYETVLADASLPAPVRKAAAMGRISAAGNGAAKILIAHLEGSNVVMQQAAIARIAEVVEPDGVAPLCALLPRLPEPSQIELLAVLPGYPRDRVLPAILEGARSNSAPVRMAALKALESTGDASVVPFLAEKAASARGSEQAAARSALGMLKGRAVDDAILKLTAQTPSEDVELELLLAISDRRIFHAKNVVASSLTSPSSRIRVQALKVMRAIGTPSDIPAVLDLLMKSGDETERTKAEQTVAALAQKIARPDARAGAIKARLASAKEREARVRLLGILPLVGDSSTLPLLRRALADSDPDVFDAAVRAFAAWPTGAAREDVLRLARDCRNETHRLLAIRGLIRIVGLDTYRDPQAVVADLRQAAGFSWRPEEQTLVLAALVQCPCSDAIELATGFLREPSVKAEAQAAIDKIRARLETTIRGIRLQPDSDEETTIRGIQLQPDSN